MAPRRDDARPLKRKGFWYLIRRVARAYAAHDTRDFAVVSPGIPITDDPKAHKAREIVRRLDSELTRYWEDKRAGRNRFQSAACPRQTGRYRDKAHSLLELAHQLDGCGPSHVA